jgi:hypothetical protein
VSLVNAAGQSVKYVLCDSNDLLLVFDLSPGAAIDNSVFAHTNVNSLFIRAQAQLADGTTVRASQDFKPSSTSKIVNHFVVKIERTGIRLAVEFEPLPAVGR